MHDEGGMIKRISLEASACLWSGNLRPREKVEFLGAKYCWAQILLRGVSHQPHGTMHCTPIQAILYPIKFALQAQRARNSIE
jgi:hypothetical protein